MRAKRSLAVACVLFGAAVAAYPADAAGRDSRQTTKAFRANQAAIPAPRPAPPAAQRQLAKPIPPAARPGTVQQAAARPATPPQAAPQRPQVAPGPATSPATSLAAPPAARAAAAPAPSRPAAVPPGIPPQAQAQAALATPAIARVGAGTPILPVAVTSGLSCVPFARMATGMVISGDARLWWHNAAGAYARGQQPERGAVLAFAASGSMSRGHVAVVSRVVNARTIHIDHANWAGPGIRRGMVMRGVTVVDVSDRNDWTAVRVQVGHDNDAFGRTYATHGFIYNRPIPGGRVLMAGGPALQEIAEVPATPVAMQLRYAVEALAE